jgi:hypothetical protein
MNNLIKTVVNFKNRINANPFSIVHAKFGNLEADISDFFTFRLDGYETIFIAENNLALLTGRIMNCRHIFHFFDKNGNLCSIYKVESEELHYKLSIKDKMTGSTEFGGFTHHIQYDDETLKQHKALLADISFQHRGYSGFRKNLTNGFSYVHGNFGGMYIDKQQNIQSLARLRGRHVYTPQFTIKPNHSYDLIFSNPMNKKICIKFLLIDSHSTKPLKKICLDSHATYKFTLHELDIKNDCNISWVTNLPVGRCVVFEYREKYFDVFHS